MLRRCAELTLSLVVLLSVACSGGGELASSCDDVVCDTPPASTCLDGNTLRVSLAPGSCEEGVCSYPSHDTVCDGGCLEGRCVDCVPEWTPLTECDCSPTTCAGCEGVRREVDGCGAPRDVPCVIETGTCAAACCGDVCCDAGEVCFDNLCCSPDCDGRQCSSDGCGGTCGECAENEVCGEDGTCLSCPETHGAGEPLAERNECGRLWYGLYSNRGDDAEVHRIPDYSFAGYRGGGVAIPEVAVVETVDPGDGDDRERIQAAIDRIAALDPDASGHRGAILLTRGTYQVGNSLRIEASGVVLRGEGQGNDGTILVATRREQHDLIIVEGEGSGLGEVAETRTPISSPLVPVGSRSFDVASTDGFSVGDMVGLLRTPNDTWLETLDMDTWGWTTGSYTIAHERRIVDITGSSVTVDIPVVDTIEDRFGGGALFLADLSGRLEEVGIEDLRLVSEYSGDTDEDHGWKAVVLQRTTNSWVRRLTAVNFGYAAVSLQDHSSFNTVEECAMLEPISQVSGGRRYSFNLTGGTGNLFQRCYSEEARHDFVSGARTTGPNVWLDCYSHLSTNDDGPHHRWATGLLFDNTSSLTLHVENRQDSGTGHGWSGAQTLFWNAVAEGIRCDAPQGAMNWNVGCLGEQQEGGWAPEEPFGWWESHGTPVEPRSLYLQQLEDRLGSEAVRDVTTADQRTGRIWGRLARWAGEGRLEEATTMPGDADCSTGLASGTTCCAADCGSCGGDGCGSRPGGADACCSGTISESGRSCQVSNPPCILDPDFLSIGEG